YNNYFYLMSAVSGVLDVVYTAVLAGIGNSLVTESITKNEKDFKVFVGINSWIIGWCSICFLCLFQPMMLLWMGRGLMLGFDTVLLLCVYFYVWKIRQAVLLYKDAAGMWHEDYLRPYVEMGVNLAVNIILVQTIGINGIVISTIISMALISLPWETHVFFKKCFHKSPKSYYYSILKIIIITMILATTTYFLCQIIQGGPVFLLLARFGICVVVPNLLLILLGRNNQYFREVISHMMMFMKSIKKSDSPVIKKG
ncbi:MAG: polysaccharide biosynthesis protein, partial [Lachnospiraceae bacterium]|nr:polysaccharide biosynthesis protein [Lachnospiraceae bacterium]